VKKNEKRPIKPLTINHIAAAGIRSNKRAYLSLAVGIFLSIFLITVIFLCAQGFLLLQQEKLEQKMGRQDGFFMDSTLRDFDVMQCGLFERLGHVYVTASASVSGMDEYLGYYDSDAAWILNRTLKEGRFPQQPGEIAVEQSVLEALRSEVSVGQHITLDLTPVDGVKESRTFLLVGILGEQSDYLNPQDQDIRGEWDKALIYSFPSILTSPKEASFQTGRTAVHQLVAVKDGYDSKDALNYWCYERREYPFFVVMADGRVSPYRGDYIVTTYETSLLMIILGMVGLAFIIACGIGIAQAMEGQLSRKVEQIGMLRAVGATRRQIRKIFGREAWILALVLSPLSVAGGCLFVVMLEWIFPDIIRFEASVGLLLPIILFSTICIFIFARIPLMKASRIMPMQVIRDTTLLRRSKSIKSRKYFSVPRLISSRQFRIHPARPLGAMILVALMLYCTGMGVYVTHSIINSANADQPDFSLYNSFYSSRNSFIDLTSPRMLTEQDMAQIRAIAQVDHIVVKTPIKVNILLDEVTPYFKKLEYYVYFGDNAHLRDGTSDALKVLRDMFSVRQIPLEILMHVVDIDSAKALQPYIIDGDVDIAALDSGREVLVFAPGVHIETANGGWHTRAMVRGQTYIEDSSNILIENDYFTAGRRLPLMLLSKNGDYPNYDDYGNDRKYYKAMYEGAARQDAAVIIGAVLDSVPEAWGLRGEEPCIITTEKGLRALGMNTGNWQQISVYLHGEVDLETEAQIEERISTIAMRGTQVRVWNNLAIARAERADNLRLTMALLSVAVTFFAVSVSIISGSVRRRIRADMRMIGTLRAVGANERVIAKCYSGHISISIIAGLILAVPLYFKSLEGISVLPDAWLVIAVMLSFAAVCYICCRSAMKIALHEVMKKSVVENIREL